MTVLVTGAAGFPDRWLVRTLGAGGLDMIGTQRSDELDITDRCAVAAVTAATRPDAIAHLAAV